MLDSGLSYSMVPQEDISQIEKALESQGIKCEEKHTGDSLELYQCACGESSLAALQPLMLSVGSK
jgi:hypothetical protein